MADRLEWLIVGGGIHGVHLAVRLIAEARVDPEALRIVDPAPTLLHGWSRCVANTGMTHLRSPAVHHIDSDPWSLLHFAGAGTRPPKGNAGQFAAPYGRPSVGLFAAHCDAVIARYGLADRHLQDRVTSLELDCDRVTAHTVSSPPLEAQRVILALGAGSQPRWPAWARHLRDAGHPVQHVFEPGFALEPDALPRRVAVFGGGISAAQVALRLARSDHEVHLISRHAFRKHQFDSDPGWAGPKNMRRFTETDCVGTRREMIRAARHGGSMPPDVLRALTRGILHGPIQHHQTAATGAEDGGQLIVDLGKERLEVDAMLLATGFEGQRPGGPLIDELVDAHDLPCAACGYPITDRHLRWHPSIFVTGPLAELEVGPVSRNIVGARRAAERIVPLANAS